MSRKVPRRQKFTYNEFSDNEYDDKFYQTTMSPDDYEEYSKPAKKPQKVKTISAKTPNQADYIRAIVENHVIFCTGPAGSGKSFIAAGVAANHLHHGKIDKVIVTRPMVANGQGMGFLPGDVKDKFDPYMTPMQENLLHFLGRSYYGEYSNGVPPESKRIFYNPLELMRGATYNGAYMILDEAQNCDLDQIKMFITRMGKDSKVIINGDTKQTDLKSKSGLQVAMERLEGIDGVGIVKLTYQDIQRHGILGDILDALESE